MADRVVGADPGALVDDSGMCEEAQGVTSADLCAQGVVIALEPLRRGVTDVVDGLDRLACIVDAEALTVEDVLITLGVQVREAGGEFHRGAVHGDGAVGALVLGALLRRQVVGIDGQEPAHVRASEFEVAGGAFRPVEMDGAVANGTEDPGQHVEEVDANVGGDAAGLLDLTLPTVLVPIAAGCDVGDLDVLEPVGDGLGHLPKRDDAGLPKSAQRMGSMS